METKDLVDLVNKKLQMGMSTAAVEKEMGLGKDTLRKKLNRANYKYDKVLKQYINKDSMVYNDIPCCKEPQGSMLDNNIVCHTEVNKIEKAFNEEDVFILKAVINQYKAQQEIRRTDTDEKGKLKARSINVYTDSYNQFAQWCKQNGITQADAIHKATQMLMNSF